MLTLANLIQQILNGFLVGAITFYPTDYFENRPLYCAQYLGNDLTYSRETAEIYGIWIALDVELYQSGWVKCGDQLTLWLEGQEPIMVTALDAGTFDGYLVMDLPIVADMPEYWLNHSTRGILILPQRKER
jgi:hypothetical protein